METKKTSQRVLTLTYPNLRNISQFEVMVIHVLKTIVPSQEMSLKDEEGNKWKSSAIESHGFAVTTITKNEKVMARVFYDYEQAEEEIKWVGYKTYPIKRGEK